MQGALADRRVGGFGNVGHEPPQEDQHRDVVGRAAESGLEVLDEALRHDAEAALLDLIRIRIESQAQSAGALAQGGIAGAPSGTGGEDEDLGRRRRPALEQRTEDRRGGLVVAGLGVAGGEQAARFGVEVGRGGEGFQQGDGAGAVVFADFDVGQGLGGVQIVGLEMQGTLELDLGEGAFAVGEKNRGECGVAVGGGGL